MGVINRPWTISPGYSNMRDEKFDLIDEQKSPLFRIMSIYDNDDPTRREFENNICAFHISNGFVLSVAHNLRIEAQLIKSIPEEIFQNQIARHLDESQSQLFNQSYTVDSQTNKRYLNLNNPTDFQPLINTLKTINFDTRYINFYEKNICKPFLIIQFRDGQFYNDASITSQINSNNKFHEPTLNRHTFIIELELVEAFYNADIALYKIINTNTSVIEKIPYVGIDFEIYDESDKPFFCLQSAPIDNLGRLLNKAQIEGILDHWDKFRDRFDGDYIMDGQRYLIKGYFRFGSSGAPYLIYDDITRSFKVNAIQSEASPIQLSINNNRNGNFQYINAIASPLGIIKDKIMKIFDD